MLSIFEAAPFGADLFAVHPSAVWPRFPIGFALVVLLLSVAQAGLPLPLPSALRLPPFEQHPSALSH